MKLKMKTEWYNQKIDLKWMQDSGACWSDGRLEEAFFRHKKEWDLCEFIERCHALELDEAKTISWLLWSLIGGDYLLYRQFIDRDDFDNRHLSALLFIEAKRQGIL